MDNVIWPMVCSGRGGLWMDNIIWPMVCSGRGGSWEEGPDSSSRLSAYASCSYCI